MPASHHRIPFHFHAEGHGFSAEFRHPLWSIIPAQASSSLPTIGGHATSDALNFHFQDFVSFKAAHTHISGRQRKDGCFVTHASTTLTGFNLLGRVKAERIISRLTSIHCPGDPEGHITADDTRFEGLVIEGEPVEVTLRHNLLTENKTHDALVKAIASDQKSGRITCLDKQGKVAICSLVDKIKTKLPGVDAKRHVIVVKNFGKIFLAEVFSEASTKTLTMLRFELGSPHVGTATAAETRTNGQPVGP
jgi:hypothetical protein